MSNNISSPKGYFDLHTSGIGYLQRIREVPVRGGRRAQPFIACTIAALIGPASNPIKRYFDVKVSGSDAQKLVAPYLGANEQKTRLLVHFRIGDLWGDAFIRPGGENKGQPAGSLKGRLLKAEPIDHAELAQIEYHELVTRGIGYLNNPKEVTPKDAAPFLACIIGALTGPVDEPEYRYIDTTVTVADAQHLVRRCVEAIKAKRKVLVAFRLNDMKADAYIRTKGEHAGEPAVSLRSKLIHISLIKVDGQQVYPVAAQAQEEAGVGDTVLENAADADQVSLSTP
ncbi:DUF3577 domain-containing protein [Dickeya fangzhongdai]|uniref:DUF3577 domain-containing protein n=1 Tax=Dickeya fangzhongdai TaxID=1778540 RepID=UPI0009B82FB5|nr:DUF3577 domain-containing protein [Dickeya fangzhongdai]